MSAPSSPDSRQPRLAIIAALEREIAPVVRGWKHRAVERGGKTLRFYESEEAVLVCAGIGANAARIAAEAAVKAYSPQALISAGLAGSLSSDMKVGEAFFAANVIDVAGGKAYSTGSGARTLITANRILGSDEKRALAQRFAAHAVDMEAAAVAEVAAQARLPFFAVKAISDELEFPMPPMDRFVDAAGNFSTGRFIVHAAIRPRMWPVVFRLARNASRAAKALAPLVRHLIENQDSPANAIESNLTNFNP
jgi:adenosylhomocysteine nucleosidase